MSARYDRLVLGIDPGTAITGYGVVGRTTAGDFELVACGVIRTEAHAPMHLRLLELHQDLDRLMREFAPGEIAVEQLFFGRNVSTAITVGQARGVVLLTAALHGLHVAEYKPAEIKQAITGYGNADKRQIQETVRHLLGLADIPRPDDAADGVAVALCHLQTINYRSLLAD